MMKRSLSPSTRRAVPPRRASALAAIVGLALSLSLSACERSAPRPFTGLADQRGFVDQDTDTRDQDPSRADRATRRDRMVEMDQMMAADQQPLDQQPLDLALDAFVEVDAPELGQLVALSARRASWLAWVNNDHLRVARVARGAVEAGKSRRIGAGAGAMTVRGAIGDKPYLFISDGADGMFQAYSLEDLDAAPLPLELYPPLTVGTEGSTLFLVGQGAADDDGLAWRLLRPEGLGPLTHDNRGLPSPESVVWAMDHWVGVFKEGQCASLYEDADGAGFGEDWRCHATPGSRALGLADGLRLFGSVGAELRAWEGTPGLSANPATTPTLTESEGDPLISLSPARWRWLEGGDGEPTLLVQEAEGDEVRLWRLAADGLWSTAVTGEQGDQLLAVMEGSDEAGELRSFMVSWDAELGLPAVTTLPRWSLTRSLEPPAAPEVSGCLRRPEDCSGIDQDCDGRSAAACCGRSSNDFPTFGTLPRGLRPDRRWFSRNSDVGLLLGLQSRGEAKLFAIPYRNREQPPLTARSSWAEVDELIAMSSYQALVAIAAYGAEDQGEPKILWSLRDGEDEESVEGRQAPAPCANPLGLQLLNRGWETAVFCPEGLYRMSPVRAGDSFEGLDPQPSPIPTPTLTPWPEDVSATPIQWIRPWMEGEIAFSNGVVRLLVARGAENQLSLWEIDSEGARLSERSLPSAVEEITPPERSLPIALPLREGGWISRVNENQLEVWIHRVGWRSAAGSRWSYSSSISDYDPVALSVSFTKNPAEVADSFRQRLQLYIHDLSPEASYWGEPYSAPISREGFYGAHFGAFTNGTGSRPTWHTISGGGETYTFRAETPRCVR